MYMSGRQCVIRRKGPQEYTIEDAESVNGTRVNDIELTPEIGEQLLKEGDEIEAGGTRLVFHLKDTTDGRRSSPFDEASPAAKTPVGVQSSCGPETRSNHA